MMAFDNHWERSRSPERNYFHYLVILFIFIVVAPFDVQSTDQPILACREDQESCFIEDKCGKRCDFIVDCPLLADELGCIRGSFVGRTGQPACNADPLCIEQGQVGPIVPEGSNVTLTCQLDPHVQRHASQILWYSRENDGAEVVHGTYTVIDNTTTQLHINNITGLGRHIYYCTFPDLNWYDGGVVYINVGIKPDPPELTCFSHNILEFWCKFEESSTTGLKNNFTMKFRKHFFSDNGEWLKCEHYDLLPYGHDTCFVSAKANPGYEMTIQVQQNNLFGSAVQQIEFNPIIEVIPNPPSELQSSVISSRSVKMAWSLPSEWVVELKNNVTYPESPLLYQIQYTEVDNPASTRNANVEMDRSITISQLLPYTSYLMRVRCQSTDLRALSWSEWTDNITVTTAEEAPSDSVIYLTVVKNATSPRDPYIRTVTLQWLDVLKESRNGEILGYYVYIHSNDDADFIKKAQDLRVQFDLKKFHEYTVKVSAFTSIGKGPNATLTIDNLTRVPSPPEQGEFRADGKSNSSDVDIVWDEPSNPAGYVIKYELQWSQSKDSYDWSEPIMFDRSQHNYVLTDLESFKQYFIRLRVINEAGTSKWTMIGPVQSYGQAPGKPLLHEIRKVATDLAELKWEQPTEVNGELKTYMIRYKANTKNGKHAWTESVSTTKLEARVRVNCSIVSSRTEFLFEVMAKNSGGIGEPSRRSIHMCDSREVITIVMGIMSVFTGFVLICCFVMWIKNSALTKPAPDPYFIESIRTPSAASKFQWKDSRSSPKHEKESFDTLRSADSYTELLAPVIQRMCSKDSSCTSTDQGIHDMDIDSLDLKNGISDGSNIMPVNSRRCNRYSSGTGQSVVSEAGLMTMRSNSNPGMEVLSEDYEDAVFEEIPQDINEVSMPCLSHTYARSASSSVSPPSSPNIDEIGSSSSLLSNSSSGPMAYSRMASKHPQRLSSSGSDTSGVNYHTMSGQGLAPVTNNKKDAKILPYSQLSQLPPADVAIDVSDEDNPEYNQMGLREPMLVQPNTSYNQSDAPPEYHKLGLKAPMNKPNGVVHKSPSISANRFNIPSVHIGSMVKPHNEIIVATALMPTSVDEKTPAVVLEIDPCIEAKPCENGEVPVDDDHSYSIVAAKQEKSQTVKPPLPPSSPRPNISCGNSSAYVPNGCCSNGVLPNVGFTIPNGTTRANSDGSGGGGVPIPSSTSMNEGYVPNNSPPPPQSVFPTMQSMNKAHSMTNNNQGKMDGYAPATPQAMAAIVSGRPINNEAYVPNTPVI